MEKEKKINLPSCVNDGCEKIVTIRHWTRSNLPSIKSECSRCALARKQNRLIEGVTIIKKKYCENQNGHLGFICPIKKTQYAKLPNDCFHLDHIDGNHFNNISENVVTICSICHTIKGKLSGDFNSNRKYTRRK